MAVVPRTGTKVCDRFVFARLILPVPASAYLHVERHRALRRRRRDQGNVRAVRDGRNARQSLPKAL